MRVSDEGDYFPLLAELFPELQGQRPGPQARINCPLPGHENDISKDFSINTATGLWTCFRCGESGNIVTLLRALGWPERRI